MFDGDIHKTNNLNTCNIFLNVVNIAYVFMILQRWHLLA